MLTIIIARGHRNFRVGETMSKIISMKQLDTGTEHHANSLAFWYITRFPNLSAQPKRAFQDPTRIHHVLRLEYKDGREFR